VDLEQVKFYAVARGGQKFGNLGVLWVPGKDCACDAYRLR